MVALAYGELRLTLYRTSWGFPGQKLTNRSYPVATLTKVLQFAKSRVNLPSLRNNTTSINTEKIVFLLRQCHTLFFGLQ